MIAPNNKTLRARKIHQAKVLASMRKSDNSFWGGGTGGKTGVGAVDDDEECFEGAAVGTGDAVGIIEWWSCGAMLGATLADPWGATVAFDCLGVMDGAAVVFVELLGIGCTFEDGAGVEAAASLSAPHKPMSPSNSIRRIVNLLEQFILFLVVFADWRRQTVRDVKAYVTVS
jgi:hypothetical protein